MKPITEEQQKALIAFNTKKLESLKFAIKQSAFSETREDLELELLTVEIALASLTDDTFMYGISDSDGKAHFSEYCVDVDGIGVSDEVCTLNDGETDLPGGYRVVPLYTAPPVPVIKLPEKYSDHEGFLTDTEQGFNDAIDEVASIINGLS